MMLKISQHSQENTCARVSFLIKMQAACNFIKKETLAQMFFCEFCKISKNTSSGYFCRCCSTPFFAVLSLSAKNPLSFNTFSAFFFFSISVSFTDAGDSRDSRGREETIFYFTLPLPPTHEHWDIYLQLCMWDDYRVFLIATLVFTRLLLDEIYNLLELPFEWLFDDAMFLLVYLMTWF